MPSGRPVPVPVTRLEPVPPQTRLLARELPSGACVSGERYVMEEIARGGVARTSLLEPPNKSSSRIEFTSLRWFEDGD
jgi:hypothetical protein